MNDSPLQHPQPGMAETTAPAPAPTPEKKKKDKEFGRGVETMFRTSYRMHVDLAALDWERTERVMRSTSTTSVTSMLSSFSSSGLTATCPFSLM